jgi:hypothetical protein
LGAPQSLRKPTRNRHRDLATLLGTGIGLVDALDTVSGQYKGRFQTSILALRERVAGGSSLSEAMKAADPGIYDELTVQDDNRRGRISTPNRAFTHALQVALRG